MELKQKEQWADRLVPADRRVGETPEIRMQWLLRFVEKDLARLSPGDRLNLEEELRAFLDRPPPPAPRFRTGAEFLKQWEGLRIRRAESRELPKAWDVPEEEGSAEGWETPDILPEISGPHYILVSWPDLRPEVVEEIQALLRGALESIEREENTVTKLNLGLSLSPAGPSLLGDPASLARLRFAELLACLHGRVRQCRDPRCNRRFVSKRWTQHFCSIPCQNRFKQRKYRQEKKGTGEIRNRDYHAEYKRRAEKKLGRPVKVQRRVRTKEG
jgi:hypothetical protein